MTTTIKCLYNWSRRCRFVRKFLRLCICSWFIFDRNTLFVLHFEAVEGFTGNVTPSSKAFAVEIAMRHDKDPGAGS